MPRGGAITKRVIRADPIYDSVLVTQLVSKVMLDGKKAIAEKIVYSALTYLADKSGVPQVEALEKSIENVKPLLETRSRRVGGSNYQVPVEVSTRRGYALAIRWIVGTSRSRKGKGMSERLGAELLDALQGTGASVKKREDVHKQAEANKAFAHYRW